jgi:hypothetical protein
VSQNVFGISHSSLSINAVQRAKGSKKEQNGQELKTGEWKDEDRTG